jgi:hypothetical protein
VPNIQEVKTRSIHVIEIATPATHEISDPSNTPSNPRRPGTSHMYPSKQFPL